MLYSIGLTKKLSFYDQGKYNYFPPVYKIILSCLIFFLCGGSQMSPSGAPDFNAKLNNDRSISTVDPGENAERINGVGGSFYRSGHWIWADGFESGSIAAHYGNSGGTQALDNTLAWNGINSAKLITGAVNGNISDITKDFALYPTRMGLECMFRNFAAISQTNLFRIVWNLGSDISTFSYTAAVQLVADASGNYKLQLLEDNGGTGAFVDEVNPLLIKSTQASPIFHSIKFVADFNTGNYGVLYIDYLRFDFSSRLLAKSNPANALQGKWVSFVARIITNEAVAKQMNIDDIIFTADEP